MLWHLNALDSKMASQSFSEELTNREFESLSVSKRLVRSMSQKWRKKSNRSEGCMEDETTGVSLSCLTLYGKGGCKVGADTGEEFAETGCRRRSSASDEGKGYTTICGNEEASVDCFSYSMKERFWKKNNRRLLKFHEERKNSLNVHLPDDILEMCLVRLPLRSLMNARLVCKKWRNLTTAPRFMKMRRECSFQSPWLFLFGVVKDGVCVGEIQAFDASLNEWHKIDSPILKGRFLFSVSSIPDDIYIVGGRSSLANSGRLDRSSFKTHRGVIAFNPLTKSSRKVASMNHARSSPILGISEVNLDCLIMRNQSPSERRFYRSRVGGVSDVYEDPHWLSVRRRSRNSLDENESPSSVFHNAKQLKSVRQKHGSSKDSKKFIIIAVGGLGSWDEPLDSGEIYDPISNKWSEIQRLPLDFGVACSGIVCDGIFYVYSESDRLVGYDIERGHWIRVETTSIPPRVHEYYPKLVSCGGRLFMLSVSWCEGEGQIGRRNKAIRKLWELDLARLSWRAVSTHPDAPMDWNAAFTGDGDLIFGVEMFKIFGQVLDFITMFDVSDAGDGCGGRWSHISRNHAAHDLDASSCMMKAMAVMRL